ncbi:MULTISPECIES: glycosyltransferase family 4 protein [Vibrio harveyi group]|uniref:glycosyltransferase family 4 protein n=1 Tax=Vibrio harveyi group TaxID=717610 RepID=UPI001C92ED25|nr:glycosyltransferase family 4 protein [Vibrio alginolyticus]MBY4648153.1 glycosyltransferase family 4 protein [Vibrio alginolyticus]
MSSDSKSKVLFVAHVPPPNHGAAIVGERVLSIISKIYDCKLLRLSNSKSISSMGKGRTLSNVIFVLALYLKTFFYLIFYRPKIIYITPSLSGFAFLRDLPLLVLFYIYLFFSKSKVLCHVHMRPLLLMDSSILMTAWCFLSIKFEVILLSKSLRNDFSKNFNPKKLHLLSNTSQVKYDKNESLKGRQSILYIGHIMESKGAIRLLALAQKFSSKNVTFHFAGEFGGEADRAKFFNLMEHLPEGLVYYHGPVSGEQKVRLFNSADLLALPSFSEAQPLTIIEAFSCGLPVVATRTGGVVDMLDNSIGRCVEFDNFESAIIEVLGLGKGNFEQRCLNKYSRCFSESKFISECLNIFKAN